MQTENLAKIAANNFMFFWILIKLNFIPILICWKKILYLEIPQLRTNSLLFRWDISAATVIKATKYSLYYVIHNPYDVATKYWFISTETFIVILPGW